MRAFILRRRLTRERRKAVREARALLLTDAERFRYMRRSRTMALVAIAGTIVACGGVAGLGGWVRHRDQLQNAQGAHTQLQTAISGLASCTDRNNQFNDVVWWGLLNPQLSGTDQLKKLIDAQQQDCIDIYQTRIDQLRAQGAR